MLRLCRAVSSKELADILAQGSFRPVAHSLSGKWFAESAEAAKRWGELLYQDQGGVFSIVQVAMPVDVADQMFCLSMLDQIGPARYAEGDLLTLINQQHQGIAVVTFGGP